MTSIHTKTRDKQRIINLVLFSISLIPVICYFFLLAQRLSIPFDLEWGEGAGINQIQRILSGKVVYGEPTLEFAALVYTPAYYLLAAWVGKILGNLTLAGRLVSALASFGAAALIGKLAWRETRNFHGAWLASALYLGCFAISDGFFDLVRVDSLYIFFLLAAFSILLSGRNPLAMVAGGAGIALGFFIKQSALIVFFPLLIYLLITNWKRYWPVLVSAVLGIGLPFWLVNQQTGGWFSYYLLSLPREHGYSILAAAEFWVGDILSPLGIALAIGLVTLLFHSGQKPAQGHAAVEGTKYEKDDPKPKSQLGWYYLFVLGAVGASWITRASNGGGANNAMAAYAALAVLFGLGYSRAGDLISRLGEHSGSGQIFLAGLIAIQFLGLIYNPFHYLPARAELSANQALLEEIGAVDGEILIPYRSHLPFQAGMESQIHAVNLFELTGYFKGDVLPEGKELVKQIQEGICNQDYGLIVLDQPVPWFEDQLQIAYAMEVTEFSREGSRSSLLSWQKGLEAAYYPRDDFDLAACIKTIN